MALVFMMALVGPARPLTIAFRPMREVNISREEERNEIEMLYAVYVGSLAKKKKYAEKNRRPKPERRPASTEKSRGVYPD